MTLPRLRPVFRDRYEAMARRALCRMIQRRKIGPRYHLRCVLKAVNDRSGVRAARAAEGREAKERREP